MEPETLEQLMNPEPILGDKGKHLIECICNECRAYMNLCFKSSDEKFVGIPAEEKQHMLKHMLARWRYLKDKC